MNETTGLPETLAEAIIYFSKDNNAHNFMVMMRWPSGVCCPTCKSKSVRHISTRKLWECKQDHPKKQFSVKVGTIFEDSPIKLDKWLCALWLIANAKNGISSYEIHRSLGVTQKTGWFMMHRIRLALQAGSIMKLQGIVEVDETYIGGKAENLPLRVRKQRKATVRNYNLKAITMGMLERKTPERGHSRIIAEVVGRANKRQLLSRIKKNIQKGTEIHSDQLSAYRTLGKHDYNHKFVNHMICYVKDNVHTNGLENFWSLLKRTIRGTYVSVEPFHLSRYLGEQVFRFNERKDDDHGRFLKAAVGIFKQGITYANLISDRSLDNSQRPPSTSWQTA